MTDDGVIDNGAAEKVPSGFLTEFLQFNVPRRTSEEPRWPNVETNLCFDGKDEV